ncbi:hypothetical protein H2199_004251 [Coniosporium tulheliwenetii]|uniref:Uncharacterized protein n=1 Tax=Coniosporium tulheliwenetii TaxID=3383036 RepID=A0ACC2Z721_9PEZI|nr:hypothetical protein H2199_004251 [Cladosporium sp. JES 115]
MATTDQTSNSQGVDPDQDPTPAMDEQSSTAPGLPLNSHVSAQSIDRKGLDAHEYDIDPDQSASEVQDVITCDVCIIGGGASGTYAAIRLCDMGKSVVVVEKQGRLGGPTETYFDPATKETAEIGVVVWHDLPVVRDYFARFDIPLAKASFATPGVSTIHADLRSGRIVDDYRSASPNAALATYGAQLARYPYLEAGFDIPYPVSPDLLLPFGEFVEKHGIDAVMHTVFGYAQGIGDLLRVPTIYVMKLFGLDVLRNLRVGFLATERHYNGEIYEKARLKLAGDVLLNSEVVKVDRETEEHATPKNLHGFDLDDTERSLFSHFTNATYYSALIRDSGIPDTVRIRNTGADTAYNLPILPGAYYFAPTGIPGLHHVKYGSPVEMSDEQVKADMLRRLSG